MPLGQTLISWRRLRTRSRTVRPPLDVFGSRIVPLTQDARLAGGCAGYARDVGLGQWQRPGKACVVLLKAVVSAAAELCRPARYAVSVGGGPSQTPRHAVELCSSCVRQQTCLVHLLILTVPLSIRPSRCLADTEIGHVTMHLPPEAHPAIRMHLLIPCLQVVCLRGTMSTTLLPMPEDPTQVTWLISDGMPWQCICGFVDPLPVRHCSHNAVRLTSKCACSC